MTATGRRRLRRRGPRRAALAVLIVAVLAAGCTSARSNLGTSDSSCYLALPSAVKAVGSHARLIGVHLFTLGKLKREAPRLQREFSPQLRSGEKVCVLAFSGQFTPSSVSKGRGLPSGTVAVVVVATPSNRLLGTVVLRRVPLRFTHSHIG